MPLGVVAQQIKWKSLKEYDKAVSETRALTQTIIFDDVIYFLDFFGF